MKNFLGWVSPILLVTMSIMLSVTIRDNDQAVKEAIAYKQQIDKVCDTANSLLGRMEAETGTMPPFTVSCILASDGSKQVHFSLATTNGNVDTQIGKGGIVSTVQRP